MKLRARLNVAPLLALLLVTTPLVLAGCNSEPAATAEEEKKFKNPDPASIHPPTAAQLGQSKGAPPPAPPHS